jgi:hypothetical protein
MPRRAIRYDRRSENIFVEGYGALRTEGGGGFTAPYETVKSLTLTEVGHALRDWADDQRADDPQLNVSDDAPEHFGEHSTVRAEDLGISRGRFVIRARVYLDEEPAPRRTLAAQLQPLLARRHAHLVAIEVHAMPGYWEATALIGWPRPGAVVADALELALDAEALLGAQAGGELSPAAAADLVRAGRAELLIGKRENHWLEVKSQPYRLDETTQKIELATDVAAMANSAGGLILIGAKAKKLPDYEEIRQINGCRLADVSERRYMNAIRQRIHPEVRGLKIERIAGTTTGEGVVLLSIPEQSEGSKPFVVHGVLVDEKVLGAFVAVPFRRGDETVFLEPETLHARLRAGERALASNEATQLAELRAQLSEVQDASTPEWLRRVIAAARHDGLSVQHGRGSVGFSGRQGQTVTVSSDPHGPLMDELQRQRLLEALEPLGLQTRRGPRGQLIPATAA